MTAAQVQSTEGWQRRQWVKWPREEMWPLAVSVYEAAAFLRVSPDLIRDALIIARFDGKARLAHQKIGSIYRIYLADLKSFGRVEARA